jgi:23S rRNA pseudouridine1911/1915/1917 synthase
MNQGWSYYNRVDRQSAGLTLLAFYTQHYSHSSEAEWVSRIALGQISVDGQTATEQICLQAGQNLTYRRPPWEEPHAPLSFDVLYEDTDLLVIAKPSGLPVLPGGGFLEHTLLHQLRRRYPNETPVPIHRLGRGTSGLILLARSPLAKSGLSQQLRLNTLNPDPERPDRERQIRKVYLALAQGQDIPDTFTVRTAIGKIFHPNLGYVYGAAIGGKPALSHCRVLNRKTNSTLVEVTISTGRPHQIRIHLAAAGFPLVGDPLYGTGGMPLVIAANPGETIPVPGDCGYHLHAHQLIFTHPRTGQRMDWICPPPDALSL